MFSFTLFVYKHSWMHKNLLTLGFVMKALKRNVKSIRKLINKIQECGLPLQSSNSYNYSSMCAYKDETP